MKRLLICFSLLFIALSLLAQDYKKLKDYKKTENAIIINSEDGIYEVSAINDLIIKVSFKNKKLYSNRVYAPIKTNKIQLKTSENKNYIFASTPKVKVRINKKDLNIDFEYKGKKILQEEKGFFINKDTAGFRFYLKPNEKIYGTGARSISMNRRGHRFQCYNQANYGYGDNTNFLNYSIPHYLSSENYMILIDNPARATFDIDKTYKNVLEFGAQGGNMVYYFIAGDNPKQLLNTYTNFTGKQPLLPMWAYGNIQSRMGYKTQKETENIVNTMIKEGYPLDVIIIDLFWFDKELQGGKMGNLSWDKSRWPNPKKMIKKFRKKGVKTVIVSEPFFTRTSTNFKHLSDNKLLGLDKNGKTMTMPYFYFGDAGLIDIFKQDAKDWFWNQYKKQKKIGVEGWWGDLGEPEVHPDSMVHVNGLAKEVHGVYGHEWVKMLYEGYAKEYPNERFFKLGRAGYAGSQRYSLVPWSGDVGRSWSGLQAQMKVMLSMGVSGLAYMHSDAGGFAMGKKNPELYTRWIQYAVFTPIFRPHGDTGAEPEPIFYDAEKQKILKKYINLRYQMMPYTYSLAWEAATTGTPLARPLFMEVPNSPYDLENPESYFWGENILIAPIVHSGVKEKSIYLPKGKWINFWTNKQYTGGKYITKKIELKDIPVFVKEGSFIPMVNKFQTTDKYSTKELNIHYYPLSKVGQKKYTLYTDNGKTKDADKKGEYQLIHFIGQNNGKATIIHIKNSGNGYKEMPKKRTLHFTIHNKELVKSVKYNGTNIEFKQKDNKLDFSIEYTNNAKLEIQ